MGDLPHVVLLHSLLCLLVLYVPIFLCLCLALEYHEDVHAQDEYTRRVYYEIEINVVYACEVFAFFLT